MQILGYDTETTGPKPSVDRIIQAALSDGRQWLVRSPVPPSLGASRVHGFYPEDLEKPEFMEPELAFTDLRFQIVSNNVALCVFNAAFDIPLTNTEFQRYGLNPLPTTTPIIDPLVIDRQFRKGRGRRTLAALIEKYSVTPSNTSNPNQSFHDAGFDAQAALDLFRAQVEMFGLDVYSYAELSELCAVWGQRQQADFQSFKNAPFSPPKLSNPLPNSNFPSI